VNMLLDVLPRIMLHDLHLDKINALDILNTVRRLLTEAEHAVCEKASHRRALDTLALLLDDRGPNHIQRVALHTLWEMTYLDCNRDYCPNGIASIIHCARAAHRRGDDDMFVRASNTILARLPMLYRNNHHHHAHVEDIQPWIISPEWLQEWIHDLEQYFRTRNCRNAAYDMGGLVPTKWCSGIVAIADQEKDLRLSGLVEALEEGAQLGLVASEFDEEEALGVLRSTTMSSEASV